MLKDFGDVRFATSVWEKGVSSLSVNHSTGTTMNKNAFRAAAGAIAAVAVGLTAPSAKAESFLHEFDDRAILEVRCMKSEGQILAVVELTQQYGGSVNYVSAVIVPAGGMSSSLLERDIRAGETSRTGRIFLGRYSSVLITGYFLGISGAGNPIRYSIPEGTSVTCD